MWWSHLSSFNWKKDKCEGHEDFSEDKEAQEKNEIYFDEIHQIIHKGKHSKRKLMHKENHADITGVNKFYLLWKHNRSVQNKFSLSLKSL